MPYFRRPSHILVNFVIATGLLVNFTSNNFTNLEASHFVTTKIALSYYEIKNILIEIEVVVSEFSPRATGT